MSSKISEDRNPSGADGDNPSSEGTEGSGSSKNVSFTDLGKEDEWKFIAEKSTCSGGQNVAKHWDKWVNTGAVPKMGLAVTGETEKPRGNNWAEAVASRRQANKENSMTHCSASTWESAYLAPPFAVQPPFSQGWQGDDRSSSFPSQSKVYEGERDQSGKTSKDDVQEVSSGECDSSSDTASIQLDDGSDSDDFVEDSDDYDSDMSENNNEMRKKNKWFRVFFETMNTLSVDQINEPTRRWHCPACQCGPGSIAWYKGLQALITHAKTKGPKRIRLHRELAELLEEELQMRGASVIVAGEAFGKWKGLHTPTTDHDIVWPPMVMVMNTVLEQDENDKWVGMGSQELLEYFPSYAVAKARHSYGPQGHRGISVLIFEASAIGYMEAERLDKHFTYEGKDREAWEHRRVLFYPGGKRQLYGFLAHKGDLDNFNQHSQGRLQLKFEMKSYQEMVVGPMKQNDEDSRQLVCLKNKVAKLLQHSRTLEGTLEVLSQQLCQTMEENRMLSLRTKMQHEENMDKINQQEQIFKEQMEKVHEATEEKERIFEKLLQNEHTKSRQQVMETVIKESLRDTESAKVVVNEVEEVEKVLIATHVHEERKTVPMQRCLEDTPNAYDTVDEDVTRSMKK